MWAHQSYLGTERNASVILNWFQPCQCYCHLRYPGEYFRSEPLSAQVSGEDHCWRTGRLQSRKEHHRADLQPTNPLLETSPAPGKPLPCLHRLQEGLQQVWHAAMWATMKTYNNSTNPICVIKHLYDKATSAVLFNNIMILVQNNSSSPTEISTLTYPLQLISGKDQDRRLRRPQSHCQQ